MAVQFPIEGLYGRTAQIARCAQERSPKAKKPTPRPVTANFLSHRFFRYRFKTLHEVGSLLENQVAVETSFFSSLAYLNAGYGLGLNVKKLENAHQYPANIDYAIETVKKKLEAKDNDLTLTVLQTESQQAVICLHKTFDTGYNAFFVPLAQLWDAIKVNHNPKACGLLCSMVAYLLQRVELPFFSENSTYLYYGSDCYLEMLQDDCVTDAEPDAQNDELENLILTLDRSRHKGRIFKRYLANAKHLTAFAERYQQFVATQAWESTVHQLAGKYLELVNDYPYQPYYVRFEPEITTNESDDYHIPMEQRIGFIWDIDDVYDHFLESLDAEFNGGGEVDDPIQYHIVDAPMTHLPEFSFDYESRLYSLIDSLVDCLVKLRFNSHE